MKAENEMTLTFPSRSSNESFARAAVACFAAQLDPNLEELNDIKTAVSEAVTNAVVHAYPDKLGTVQVRVRILPDERLEIVVKDHGIGIADVAQARTPLYTTGGEERSGMGFTIMESFMTSLRVTSRPGFDVTCSEVMKLSMIVKPMPLRSGPPVVNMGVRAFSMSSIPQPLSRTTTSRTLSGRMRQRMVTRPIVSR